MGAGCSSVHSQLWPQGGVIKMDHKVRSLCVTVCVCMLHPDACIFFFSLFAFARCTYTLYVGYEFHKILTCACCALNCHLTVSCEAWVLLRWQPWCRPMKKLTILYSNALPLHHKTIPQYSLGVIKTNEQVLNNFSNFHFHLYSPPSGHRQSMKAILVLFLLKYWVCYAAKQTACKNKHVNVGMQTIEMCWMVLYFARRRPFLLVLHILYINELQSIMCNNEVS